jgi:hypothetical protein
LKDAETLGKLASSKPWYCKSVVPDEFKQTEKADSKEDKVLKYMDKEKRRELKRQVKALKKQMEQLKKAIN